MEDKAKAGGNRRSIRLRGADYSQPGIYFVTLCSDSRRPVFGRIETAEFIPTVLGKIVRECWVAIPDHFPRVSLDKFVIMPNHIHGLLVFGPVVGAQQCCALGRVQEPRVKAGSLAAIVRSFKAIVTRRAHDELRWQGEVWQRNYFEHIVREGELADTQRYIVENPKMWELDEDNPQRWSSEKKGAAVLRPYK